MNKTTHILKISNFKKISQSSTVLLIASAIDCLISMSITAANNNNNSSMTNRNKDTGFQSQSLVYDLGSKIMHYNIKEGDNEEDATPKYSTAK